MSSFSCLTRNYLFDIFYTNIKKLLNLGLIVNLFSENGKEKIK